MMLFCLPRLSIGGTETVMLLLRWAIPLGSHDVNRVGSPQYFSSQWHRGTGINVKARRQYLCNESVALTYIRRPRSVYGSEKQA